MATIVGKTLKAVGKGVKNGTKAVGKGVENAAKFTAKNPLKVLAPIAGAAGVLATGGALAPTLTGKLAATKVGGTQFGKMVTKTMSTGTIVREKIANTLKKKNGKTPSSKDVSLVEKGLNAEIKKRKGFNLPVDKTSKTGTEARAKLKEIGDGLMNRVLDAGQEKLRATLNAERQVLIDNPETNGILSKDEIPASAWNQMQQAGPIQENLLGQAASGLTSLFGGGQIAQEKAADVMDIISGKNRDPYLSEDAEQGVKFIEAKQNQQASMIPESIGKYLKMPMIWIAALIIGGVFYLFNSSNKNKKRKK